MKLADFKIYQKKTDELNEAKQAVLDAANGLIESWTWQYTEDLDDEEREEYADSEWLEVVNHEVITDTFEAEQLINLMSDGMATEDTETIEDYNKAVAERNAKAQADAEARNAQLKADYDAKLKAYEKALADRQTLAGNQVTFMGYGKSEVLNSYGQRTSDTVVVNGDGTFTL